MASGQIPIMNTAGTNQTSPVANPIMKTGPGVGSFNIPGSPTSSPTQNSYMGPTTPVPLGTSSGAPTSGGLVWDPSNKFGTSGAFEKQLKDIWGKGTGGAYADLYESLSGIDSAALQNFIKSLGPQFAQQAVGLSTRLGAGGVSPNSSVNAIAQSNLTSQENATIAGESAKIMLDQEQLQASMLQPLLNPSAKEVATSGWSVFANVMNQITGDIGNLMGGSYTPASNTVPAGNFSAPQLDFGGPAPSTAGVQAAADSMSYGSGPDLSMFPA